MDLALVQSELDYVDEAYKRNLQVEVAHKLKDKPTFSSINQMLDWKMDLFSFQYHTDKRFKQLFSNYLTKDEEDNFIDTVILNPYFENVPFFKQTLLLLCRGDVLFGGARGGGKALALNTPVATPDGFRTIEDIMVGDEVFDCNGKPCHVTSKSDIFFDHDCYEILFDDGVKVVCDGNHKWFASTYVTRIGSNNRYNPLLHPAQVYYTKDMAENIYDYAHKQDGVVNYSILNCGAVEYDSKEGLPVSPYMFGVWLASGDFDGGLTVYDDVASKMDLDSFTHKYSNYWCSDDLKDTLKDLGFEDGVKFIPKIYLYSSISDRISLLHGFMDCKGLDDCSVYECIINDKRLRDDFRELLASLGIKSVSEKSGYNVKVFFATDIPMGSKDMDSDKRLIKKYSHHFIINIKKVGSVPCQCITVDSPTHQFLITDHYIATHNSDSALMSALQYVEFPEWTVGIFRLTYKDLTTPGAILNRAESWLDNNELLKREGIEPKYKRTDYSFTFPSGAQIQFAQVQFDQDAQHFQGAELHKTIIDEAVQFTETKINRLKGSIRRNIDDPLPTEILYTGNPGGVSTEYFRNNFVDGDGQFIDSKYIDNCYLDFTDYERRVFEDLKDSDPVLYAQWKLGDWNASNSGSMFKQDWFKYYTFINERITHRVRAWDMASTDPVNPSGSNDPDYCVGTLLMKGESGRIYVDNQVRFRADPDEVEENIINIANQDGFETPIIMEQEGGSQAKTYMAYLQRKLQGHMFYPLSSRKDKIERAKPMVSAIKFGNTKFRDGEDWIYDMINEMCSFPTVGIHDDIVDSLSLGFNYLNGLSMNDGLNGVNNYYNNDMLVRLNRRV